VARETQSKKEELNLFSQRSWKTGFGSESVLKISDRDPNGFAGKQQSISGRLAAPLVNPLRQKNL
jgi:hypothetical protein